MESQTDTVGAAGRDAFGSVAAEHILDRLNAALRLAAEDFPNNIERFCELLAQTLDQANAWMLTRIVDQTADCEQPASRLECSMLSQVGSDPLEEFLLIPFGEVTVERPLAGSSFVFTRAHAESAARWLAQLGRKLAIDYEHQSFDRYNSRPDGLRPAAGWIGRLEIRDDGLWACDVTWTERARELLKSGEYRYFSPVIYWTDEDYSDVAALGPVALTNDPAMRNVQPLAAARREAGGGAGSSEGEPESESMLREELDALNGEIALLQKQLTAQEADSFVERGMRLGKIVDSTSMDWREDYLRDPERTAIRLARAPVLLPPGRLVKVDARGSVVPGRVAADLARGERAGNPTDIEAEDLEAYDRALAAGRVRRFGTP